MHIALQVNLEILYNFHSFMYSLILLFMLKSSSCHMISSFICDIFALFFLILGIDQILPKE